MTKPDKHIPSPQPALPVTARRGPTPVPVTRPDWDTPKTRDCLMCQTAFESAWSGERLCRNCKQKPTWRNGIATVPSRHPQGRGSSKGRS